MTFRLINKTMKVHRHWYVLLPDFSSSTGEFYDAVYKSLVKLEVPELHIKQFTLPEGDMFGGRRTYLRMSRERLVFDLCSTSFGNSWFFSCRFGFVPIRFLLLHLLLLPVLLLALWSIYSAFFTVIWGSLIFATTCTGLLYLLKILSKMGRRGLSAGIMRIPVIGPFYEIFIYRETYYREDARLMFCDLVNQIIQETVREYSGADKLSDVPIQEDKTPPQTDGFFKRLFGGMKRKIHTLLEP